MAKINDLVSAWMEEIPGYELSRSEYIKEGSNWYLRVYVDKLENGEYVSMSTDDCEKISRILSDKLDKDDPIKQNYYLEVSSPGLDRPLMSEKDYVRFNGCEVEVKLYKAYEVLKEFSAKLSGYDSENIIFIIDNNEVSLPKSSIAKINLAVIF